MLIVVLMLSLATSIFVAVRRKDSLSLYLLGMSLSNSIMLAGVVIYIAKMGGIAATQRTFLFLSPAIQNFLRYLPIQLGHLGYTVAVGRCLFPAFTMLAALETTMVKWVRRRLKLLRPLSFLIPAVFLVYYYPPVFYSLARGRFWLVASMITVSQVWIVLYLLLAAALLIAEYRATTMRIFKRSFRYVLASVFSIELLYLLYATKDPAQIYNLFVAEYIRLGVATFIGPGLSGLEWLVLGLCTVFFVILGSYGMVRYTQVSYDEERQDMILQRKFDVAGTGVSVFVHGIKNQLLSSRVLHKKLDRALEVDPPDLVQVRACAVRLRELNEGMLTRMDELYRSVKNNALTLSAIPVAEVVASAVERFRGKYPDQEVAVRLETDRLVLADLGHLSEAIYNLLTNGYEASKAAGREEPELSILVREERMWTVIVVHDDGVGISDEVQSKMYDPFFTSKNTNQNWGMGLYYVRRIVKGHWGRLRLESQPGVGTSFYLMLPLFDADVKR